MTTTVELQGTLSVEKLTATLATTEPLGEIEFLPDGSSPVKFTLEPGWATGLQEMDGTDVVPAHVKIDKLDLALTKDALLQATSFIGLTQQYTAKTPASLIEPQLNYWFSHVQNKVTKFLTVGNEVAVAFVKGSVSPVSNLKLLSTITSQLNDLFASDVLVDFKLHHDLRLTNYRLILPDESRTIASARNDEEKWSFGLDVVNSLTAESGIRLRGYLFAWECGNGMVSTHASSGTWSRRGAPTEDQAIAWVEESIADVISGLEHEIESVQALTEISISGEVNHTLQDIFEKYKVPTTVREEIITELIESDDLTMFGVHAAITKAANRPGLAPTTVARLLEIGGDLPATTTNRCSACHRLPI